jgi:hypothetical protein
MRRRLILTLAAVAGMFGIGAMVAAPVSAEVTHIHTIDAGLLRVCVIYSAADVGLCIHV